MNFKNIFNSFLVKLGIKKDESEKIDYTDKVIDAIFDKILSLKASQQTVIGAMFFGAGVFIQFSFISSFLGGGIDGIYFVNIESTILFSFLFIFVLIVSLFFPILLILILILSIFGAVFSCNLLNYLTFFIVGTLIIGVILLKYKWYWEFMLKVLKKSLAFLSILYLIGVLGIFYVFYHTNKEVNIKTENGSFTGKLYFSNGENYFLEKNGRKVILPMNEVKEIEYFEK